MAVVKYGAIVTEIKGKVGGSVFQGGRSGGIIKNNGYRLVKSIRGGDLKRLQGGQIARTNFSIVTKSWASLTEVQRSNWDALLGVWTFINKFGDVYNGTAFQIYTAVNINRLILEEILLSDAPIKANATDPVITVADYSLGGTWDIATTVEVIPDQKVVLSFTLPQAATKNFGSTSPIVVSVVVISIAAGFDAKGLYQTFFGTDPPLGSIFYMTSWTAIADYPRKQFLQTFKVNVIA